MKRHSRSLRVVALALYAFLYAPILVIIIYSFNTNRFGLVWQGFTLDWYRALIEDRQALSALKNTAELAVISTVLATALGTALGYGLTRSKIGTAKWVANILYVPVFIPDVVMAVALLMFYELIRKWLGIFELGLTTMVIAHVCFQIPFVAIVVRARLDGLDPILEEAARDLGANGWRTFRFVTWPLLFPGVLAAAMLAFTLSLDDFVVSFFTSGPGSTTLPILIYSSLKRGITPEINTLSTLIIIASVLGSVAAIFFQRRHETP